MYTCIDKTMQIVLERGSIDGMPNTYACKAVSNPNVPIFPPRVCTLVLFIFSVFSNDLLKEVDQTGLGLQLSSGKTVEGMLFVDDFVGISDSKESLQKLLDVVYSYEQI